MDATTIKRRTASRMSDRSNIDGLWNLIERFVVPFRAMIFQNKNSEGNVDWRRRELYDPTAIKANSNLAAHIHGALTNSVMKWHKQVYHQSKWNTLHETKEWLEEADKINYQSIQESNFDLEANEIYLDLTSFGSGTMSSMPEESNIGELVGTDYKTLPVDECYFDFGLDGVPINFYRMLQWTPIQMVDKWGLAGVTEKIRADYESDDRSNVRQQLVFCIFKRNPAPENFNPFVMTAIPNRPFGSKYILYETGDQIGPEGGYHEMPVFAPRWRRVSGSQWGFSPSMIAIWDVLTLNQLNELVLVAAEKVIDPAIMTTKKGVFGDIDLSSNGVIVVQDIEKSMRAFESGARFDVSALTKSELVQSIREAYFVDDLQLKKSPAMTASEVHARIQLMQRLLGPTFGRLQKHFLDPLVSRQFLINYRYKKFPPLPPILEKERADLRIEYLGTLAKSQKMDAAASVERFMGSTVAMADAYPEVLDIPNVDEVVREMAENEGIPTKLVRSRAVVKKARGIKLKQKQEAAQLETATNAGQAAEAAGKGMQALKEGGVSAAPA